MGPNLKGQEIQNRDTAQLKLTDTITFDINTFFLELCPSSNSWKKHDVSDAASVAIVKWRCT